MDPAHHRRNRARHHTAAGADNSDRRGGRDDAGGDSGARYSANDGSGSGGGGGREKVYSGDYNDRACAVLLKYQRVAGFVLGAGEQDGGTGRRKPGGKNSGAAAPSPEDIVEWLDERLLDKNVAPLYRTGLRPEHVQPVLETLLSGGGGSRDSSEKAALFVLGGLEEAAVRAIVAGEAGRGEAVSSRGGERAQEVEEISEEAAAVVSSMFGDGEGPQGRETTQTGPWQKK